MASSLTDEADEFFSTISWIYKEFRTFELLDNKLTKIVKDDLGFLGRLTQQFTEMKERW